MSTHRDPFTGEEWVRGPGGQLRRPCPPDCVGGYRPVNPLYAVSIADPDDDPVGHAAALKSVYFCETCRPEQYKLWSEGHMTPEHLGAGGCAECRPKTKGGKR